MSNANYPDSVNPGDPDAPWNAPDPVKAVWEVSLRVTVIAYGEDEAIATIQRAVADAGDLETISAVYIEDV